MHQQEHPHASERGKSVEDEFAPKGPSYVYLILGTAPDSPAAKAGLMPDDEVVEVAGKAVGATEDWSSYIEKGGSDPVTVKVMRAGAEVSLTLTPEWLTDEKRYRFGVSFISESRPQETVETVESEGRILLRHKGRMFDAERREVCAYTYDLDAETFRKGMRGARTEDADKTGARRLCSFVLRGSDGNEIDLLARFNPGDVPVYVMAGRPMGTQGIHDFAEKEIILRRMEGSPADVHVLLHELRHAQQASDPRFSKLLRYYDSAQFGPDGEPVPFSKQMSFLLWPDRTLERLSDILVAAGLPAAKARLVNDEVRAEIERIDLEGQEKRLAALRSMDKERLEKMKAGLKPPLTSLDKIHELSEQSMSSSHQAKLDLELAPGISVWDVLTLPRRMIERDAEFGALKAARDIRGQTGINLLTAYVSQPMLDTMRRNESKLRQSSLANEVSDDERTELEKVLADMQAFTGLTDQVKDVRRYMEHIGATPAIIRKYLEADEPKQT